MSVGFGFSVGDFLATIKLVGTVVDALRETSHSATQFHDLLKELESLDTALDQVNKIEFDESQRFQKIALYQTASQCQRSIDAFWFKIKKYQTHLSSGGTGFRTKDGWAKVKWAVCRKKDMKEFRAEVRGHICSIQVLLEAINAETQRKQYFSLAGKIQTLSLQVMNRLHTISNAVVHDVAHSTNLMQICGKILQTDLRIFSMVYDIHLFITRIPGQVQRQQPVYLIDPFNRETPFHLEFIRSAEALRAVLAANFKALDCDTTVIDRGDFVIEELGSRRVIDLTKDWEICFFPNQRVAMSVVLREKSSCKTNNYCPGCQNPHTGIEGVEISCSSCGIIYRRTAEPPELPQDLNGSYLEKEIPDTAELKEDELRGSCHLRVPHVEQITPVSKFRRFRIVVQGMRASETADRRLIYLTEANEETMKFIVENHYLNDPLESSSGHDTKYGYRMFSDMQPRCAG